MSQSPDHPWTCPECRQEVDYYECGKRRDPRSTRFRSVCGDCFDRITKGAGRSGGPYRGEVGSKGGGASWDAAEQMKTKAGRLRVQCLDMIAQHGPQGADRLAFLMDEDEDLISPRLSELVTMGVLEKGPRTATTKRGNRAHVYQLSGKEVKAA